MANLRRGEIYYIEPCATVGCEQRAGRPAIIVSNDLANSHSSVVEIVYLTTQPKVDLPTHVVVYGTGRESTALCEQITSVSIDRIGSFAGTLSSGELRRVELALMASLAISSKLSEGIESESPPPPETHAIDSGKLEAERDVYKRLYEGLLTQILEK